MGDYIGKRDEVVELLPLAGPITRALATAILPSEETCLRAQACKDRHEWARYFSQPIDNLEALHTWALAINRATPSASGNVQRAIEHQHKEAAVNRALEGMLRPELTGPIRAALEEERTSAHLRALAMQAEIAALTEQLAEAQAERDAALDELARLREALEWARGDEAKAQGVADTWQARAETAEAALAEIGRLHAEWIAASLDDGPITTHHPYPCTSTT